MALVACVVACRPVGGEPSPEPAAVRPVASSPSPEPEVAPAPAPAPEPEPEPAPPLDKPWRDADEARILAVQPFVAEAAADYGVDPYLVNGLIWVESGFRPKAKNKSGARGLMQLMPTTAKALGRAIDRPAKPYDPEWSVHAGTYYLSRQLRRFDGDETLALAAYARGPGRVREWVDAGEPLPASLQGFVAKVQRTRDVFAALGWPEPLAASDDGAGDDLPTGPEPASDARASSDPNAARAPKPPTG
jgi:soluble lytic murein transglycosylase-like protein